MVRYFFAISLCVAFAAVANAQLLPIRGVVTPPPVLLLSFNPPNPSIASSTLVGVTVATVTATWSDGSPFTGALGFGPPNYDDGGTFALSGNALIINPS